jgi:hypothetical protein
MKGKTFQRKQESITFTWIDFVEPLKRVPSQARNVTYYRSLLCMIADTN